MLLKSKLILVILYVGVISSVVRGQYDEIKRILSKCHRSSKKFDSCMLKTLNKINPFFGIGIPEYGVAPFDPHFATEVNQYKGSFGATYHLKLTDVYERGWTKSKITKYRTEWKKDRIVYTQYFPEKSLSGLYDLDAYALGTELARHGKWNMTLYDYTQTTTLTRLPPLEDGSRPLDVHVEIDRIGNMQLHVSNILNGRNILENILDAIINATWRPGFLVVRPLINELVSTAFTEIWTNSFKNFPLEDLIPK